MPLQCLYNALTLPVQWLAEGWDLRGIGVKGRGPVLVVVLIGIRRARFRVADPCGCTIR